jgi:methyl-accepting chemotaxis protein
MNGKNYLYVGLVLVVLFACWFVFGTYRDSTEGSISSSIRRVGTEHERVSEAIGRTERGLEDSLGRVAELEELTQEAERSASTLEERLERMSDRVDAGKRVVENSQRRIAEYRKWCEGY